MERKEGEKKDEETLGLLSVDKEADPRMEERRKAYQNNTSEDEMKRKRYDAYEGLRRKDRDSYLAKKRSTNSMASPALFSIDPGLQSAIFTVLLQVSSSVGQRSAPARGLFEKQRAT
jgi:hypothetical protein